MKKIFATALLSFALLAGGFFPQQAQAQVPVLEGGPNLFTNVTSTVKAIDGFVKDYVLDGLAWQVANIALEQMTQDIVVWINSGFNGSPAFIQNPGRFLGGIADGAAGDFLQKLGGGFLCSPFSADLRLSLEIGYYAPITGGNLADRYSCTLSGALGNVEQFLDNDLSQGGLEQFFNVTARPENNPYMLALDLRSELSTTVSAAIGGEQQLLDWNGGFLSRRECLEGQTEPNCTGDVLTPGDTIQNQLNESLGIGQKRLLVADNINEIVGALMNQLVSQAIGGAQGLIGTSNSGGGNPSYFDQTNDPDITSAERNQLSTLLTNAVQSGNQTAEILSGALVSANTLTNMILAAQSGSCTSANLTRLGDISSETSRVRSNITGRQTELYENIATLQELSRTLLGAQKKSEYISILTQYQDLTQAGRVPNEATVGEARITNQQLETLKLEVQTIQSNCNA